MGSKNSAHVQNIIKIKISVTGCRMDDEINFLYVLGWFEFLNSIPGNKFHFLKCAPGIFGRTWT